MNDVNLHHGDCFDFINHMSTSNVDHVVTDPPFNAGKDFENDQLTERGFRIFCNRFALALCEVNPKNILVEVGKNDRTMYEELIRYFKFEYHIILNYTNSMRNGKIGYSNFGLVLWFSNGGQCHKRFKDRLDSALHSTIDDFSHPSPKEVDHYRQLVAMFSLPDDTIFDPFMGSGTTGVASVQLGRNFTGCEINPDYFEIAKKRIAEELKQPTLFTAEMIERYDHQQLTMFEKESK